MRFLLCLALILGSVTGVISVTWAQQNVESAPMHEGMSRADDHEELPDTPIQVRTNDYDIAPSVQNDIEAGIEDSEE
jgi:hypothetical protein